MSTSAPDGALLLEARSVTRLFGGLLAVDTVDLAVRRGSVHGLIGPNGAGKTTLLNLIAGVYRVSSGELHYCARDITRYSTAKRARAGIRRTFQNLKLFGEMTALENVAIGLHAETRSGFFDTVVPLSRMRAMSSLTCAASVTLSPAAGSSSSSSSGRATIARAISSSRRCP